MIPEEDHGPRWLGDTGTIEADIRQLREFATRLDAQVRGHYAPFLPYIADDMSVVSSEPCAAFIELVHFLTAHQQIQQETANQVFDVANHTGHLAGVADIISQRYEGSDAFARARVQDVEAALRQVRASAGGPPLTVPDPTTTMPGAIDPVAGGQVLS